MNRNLFILLFILFVSFSCSTEKKDWEKTESENTILAYENFLSKYSTGPHIEKARLNLDYFNKKRKSEFKNVKIIEISLEDSYGDAKDVNLPFEKISKQILKYAGIQFIKANEQSYDAVLKINAEGQPISAEYEYKSAQRFDYRPEYEWLSPDKSKYVSAGHYFSGASLSGTISFEVSNILICQKSFYGSVKPKSTIIERIYTSPSNAPFEETLNLSGSFTAEIIELMGEACGLPPILQILRDESLILKDENQYIRKLAEESLYKLNPEWQTSEENRKQIPDFIRILKSNKDKKVKKVAIRLLEDIGGSQVIDGLLVSLEDDSFEVRMEAVRALDNVITSDFTHLISNLRVKREYLKKKSLEYFEKKLTTNTNMELLKYKDQEIRSKAAIALGRIKDVKSVNHLIEALRDKDSRVIANSIWALGEIKDIRAIEPIIMTLKYKDHEVRWSAEEALWKLTGEDFGEDYDNWKKWWEENKKKFIKEK